MNIQLNKEQMQEAEMLLNIIINSASRLTPGNVSHNSSEIKGSAERVKEILTRKPKYKCSKCKDTGIIHDEEYRGHTEGFVPIEKKCQCRQ